MHSLINQETPIQKNRCNFLACNFYIKLTSAKMLCINRARQSTTTVILQKYVDVSCYTLRIKVVHKSETLVSIKKLMITESEGFHMETSKGKDRFK